VEKKEKKIRITMCHQLVLRLCVGCFLVMKVSLHPVSPFSSCGCLAPSSTTLSDTNQVSLSAAQCYSVCRERGDNFFTFDNTAGSCLCGGTSVMTGQCPEEEEMDLEVKMVEVFCVHPEQDQSIHDPFFSGLEVGKVIDEKKDTWVLAIILLCVSLVLLTVGVVKVMCQNKKTDMREQLVRNCQDTQNKVYTLSSQEGGGGAVIEWSIKL